LAQLDPINAIFQMPTPDGRFEGELGSVLELLSLSRQALILAFAPKAAGTFFRTAAIEAIDGQLLRIGHAMGGRDVQPYLPIFVAYYLGHLTPDTMVAHAHMQALPANRNFMEALNLRPVIMLRPIPDMLASYRDMLDTDADARAEGLNCKIPDRFTQMTAAERSQFMVDVVAPWYASYFATWFEFARDDPTRVCVLDYADFLADPVATLETALRHAQIAVSTAACRAALDKVWHHRDTLRFNRGIEGRGRGYFSEAQLAQIERQLVHYDIEPAMRDRLMGRNAGPHEGRLVATS